MNNGHFMNSKTLPHRGSSLRINTKKHRIKPIFSHSCESSLTPGIFRSDYQPVTALNHLSLCPQLPYIPHHYESTKIQGDHKETVRERTAHADACVCVTSAQVCLAVSVVESRVCVKKLSAVDMSLEVPLQIYETVRPHC